MFTIHSIRALRLVCSACKHLNVSAVCTRVRRKGKEYSLGFQCIDECDGCILTFTIPVVRTNQDCADADEHEFGVHIEDMDRVIGFEEDAAVNVVIPTSKKRGEFIVFGKSQIVSYTVVMTHVNVRPLPFEVIDEISVPDVELSCNYNIFRTLMKNITVPDEDVVFSIDKSLKIWCVASPNVFAQFALRDDGEEDNAATVINADFKRVCMSSTYCLALSSIQDHLHIPPVRVSLSEATPSRIRVQIDDAICCCYIAPKS